MRLIILTSSARGLASDCLERLASRPGIEVTRVVLSHGLSADPNKVRRRKLAKMLRIGPLGALNGVRMRAWYRSEPGEILSSLCERLGIPYFETPFTNGPEMEGLFKDAEADLGLSLGNSYISPRVFGIPRYGMINFHGEVLPAYQNAQGVIWPIYNGERQTGITIHQIDKGIDTGAILYQETYPIEFRRRLRDTVEATNRVTRSRAPEAIAQVCEHYLDLARKAAPQPPGRSYTTPTFAQFLRIARNNRRLYRQSAA